MTKESKKPPYAGHHRKDQPKPTPPPAPPASGKVPKGGGQK